ncbi:MAG: hypothetical protein ACOC1P_00430 [Minisyncoccales bacterium]
MSNKKIYQTITSEDIALTNEKGLFTFHKNGHKPLSKRFIFKEIDRIQKYDSSSFLKDQKNMTYFNSGLYFVGGNPKGESYLCKIPVQRSSKISPMKLPDIGTNNGFLIGMSETTPYNIPLIFLSSGGSIFSKDILSSSFDDINSFTQIDGVEKTKCESYILKRQLDPFKESFKIGFDWNDEQANEFLAKAVKDKHKLDVAITLDNVVKRIDGLGDEINTGYNSSMRGIFHITY